MKEKVLVEAIYSPLINSACIILTIAFCIFAVIMANSDFGAAVIIAILGIVIGKIFSSSTKYNSLCITEKRVYGKAKILLRTEELDMPINKIESVSISTTFFGSLFGYKTIIIRATHSGWRYKYITNAEEIREQFYELMDNN